MGLDMFLSAKISLPSGRYTYESGSGEAAYSPNPEADKLIAAIGADHFRLEECGMVTLELPVGCWRKANWIHAWFIRDQDEDDCQPIEVDFSDLLDLDQLCLQALQAKTPEACLEILPPLEGFFFGPTDLEDQDNMAWYTETLADTRRIITSCRELKEHFARRDFIVEGHPLYLGFEYRASW